LAEIDRRLRDGNRTGRGKIVDHIIRQAFADHSVDRAGRDAVPVGVVQALVDPVLSRCREAAEVELACADLELLVLPVDRVAVEVPIHTPAAATGIHKRRSHALVKSAAASTMPTPAWNV